MRQRRSVATSSPKLDDVIVQLCPITSSRSGCCEKSLLNHESATSGWMATCFAACNGVLCWNGSDSSCIHWRAFGRFSDLRFRCFATGQQHDTTEVVQQLPASQRHSSCALPIGYPIHTVHFSNMTNALSPLYFPTIRTHSCIITARQQCLFSLLMRDLLPHLPNSSWTCC